MRSPENVTYKLILGLIKKMRLEFEANPNLKEHSTLYKLIADESVGNMKSSFDMIKNLLMKDGRDNREIVVGLHDPQTTRSLPSITITSPGDAWSESNTLGGGETANTHFQGDALVSEIEVRFNSQINIVITASNQLETQYLYTIIRNGMAGILQVASISGVENPKISGRKMEQDQMTHEGAPSPIYSRAVIIDFYHTVVQKGLFTQQIVNDLVANVTYADEINTNAQ